MKIELTIPSNADSPTVVLTDPEESVICTPEEAITTAARAIAMYSVPEEQAEDEAAINREWVKILTDALAEARKNSGLPAAPAAQGGVFGKRP